MASKENPVVNEGQRRGTWTQLMENESLDNMLKSSNNEAEKESGITKLHLKDMGLFGFYPPFDEWLLVVCKICCKVIKPQGFASHLELRHGKVFNEGEEVSTRNSEILSNSVSKSVSLSAPSNSSELSGAKSLVPQQTDNNANHDGHYPQPTSNVSHSVNSVKVKLEKPKSSSRSKKNNVIAPYVLVEKIDPSLMAGNDLSTVMLPTHKKELPSPQKPPPVLPATSSNLLSSTSGPGPGKSIVLNSVVSCQPSSSQTEHTVDNFPYFYAGTNFQSHTEFSLKRPAVSSVNEKVRPKKRQSSCREREYDPDKHCGVINANTGKPCTRVLTCSGHSVSLRREVPGRSKPFDELVSEHKALKKTAIKTLKSDSVSCKNDPLVHPNFEQKLPDISNSIKKEQSSNFLFLEGENSVKFVCSGAESTAHCYLPGGEPRLKHVASSLVSTNEQPVPLQNEHSLNYYPEVGQHIKISLTKPYQKEPQAEKVFSTNQLVNCVLTDGKAGKIILLPDHLKSKQSLTYALPEDKPVTYVHSDSFPLLNYIISNDSVNHIIQPKKPLNNSYPDKALNCVLPKQTVNCAKDKSSLNCATVSELTANCKKVPQQSFTTAAVLPSFNLNSTPPVEQILHSSADQPLNCSVSGEEVCSSVVVGEQTFNYTATDNNAFSSIVTEEQIMNGTSTAQQTSKYSTAEEQTCSTSADHSLSSSGTHVQLFHSTRPVDSFSSAIVGQENLNTIWPKPSLNSEEQTSKMFPQEELLVENELPENSQTLKLNIQGNKSPLQSVHGSEHEQFHLSNEQIVEESIQGKIVKPLFPEQVVNSSQTLEPFPSHNQTIEFQESELAQNFLDQTGEQTNHQIPETDNISYSSKTVDDDSSCADNQINNSAKSDLQSNQLAEETSLKQDEIGSFVSSIPSNRVPSPQTVMITSTADDSVLDPCELKDSELPEIEQAINRRSSQMPHILYHPRPSAICTFGMRKTKRGLVLLNHRSDAIREALIRATQEEKLYLQQQKEKNEKLQTIHEETKESNKAPNISCLERLSPISDNEPLVINELVPRNTHKSNISWTDCTGKVVQHNYRRPWETGYPISTNGLCTPHVITTPIAVTSNCPSVVNSSISVSCPIIADSCENMSTVNPKSVEQRNASSAFSDQCIDNKITQENQQISHLSQCSATDSPMFSAGLDPCNISAFSTPFPGCVLAVPSMLDSFSFPQKEPMPLAINNSEEFINNIKSNLLNGEVPANCFNLNRPFLSYTGGLEIGDKGFIRQSNPLTDMYRDSALFQKAKLAPSSKKDGMNSSHNNYSNFSAVCGDPSISQTQVNQISKTKNHMYPRHVSNDTSYCTSASTSHLQLTSSNTSSSTTSSYIMNPVLMHNVVSTSSHTEHAGSVQGSYLTVNGLSPLPNVFNSMSKNITKDTTVSHPVSIVSALWSSMPNSWTNSSAPLLQENSTKVVEQNTNKKILQKHNTFGPHPYTKRNNGQNKLQ